MRTLTTLVLFLGLNLQAQVNLSGAKLVNFSMATSAPVADVTNGLSFWWMMDDASATTLADSISGNTATTGRLGGSTNPFLTNGVINTAVDFEYQGYASLATNITNGGPWTLSCWAYLKAGAEVEVLLNDIAANSGLRIIVTNGVNVTVQLNNSGGATIQKANTVFPTNEWTFLMVTYAGGVTAASVKVYTNNVEVSSYTSQDGSGTHSAHVGGSRLLSYASALNDAYWKGYIDDLRIYNRVLTTLDATYLYNYRAP